MEVDKHNLKGRNITSFVRRALHVFTPKLWILLALKKEKQLKKDHASRCVSPPVRRTVHCALYDVPAVRLSHTSVVNSIVECRVLENPLCLGASSARIFSFVVQVSIVKSLSSLLLECSRVKSIQLVRTNENYDGDAHVCMEYTTCKLLRF